MPRKPSLVLVPLLAWLACGDPGAPAGRLEGGALDFASGSWSLGAFEARLQGTSWSDARLALYHRSRPREPVWASLPGQAFVSAARGDETVTETRGSFVVEDEIGERCPDQRVEAIGSEGDELWLSGRLRCAGRELGYTLRAAPDGAHQLRLYVSVDDPSFDRVQLSYQSDAEERFFGFGEQFTWFDLKGRRVPILVTEQGIGRGRQPITWLVDRIAGAGGDWHTSYAPVPHYLTTRNRSLFLENSEISVFDLRRADRVQVEVFSPELRARIVHGDDPLALIREYTAYAGRMRPLPDWVHHGAIIGVQGGTERVRELLRELEARETPIAAFWLQDWVGQRTTSFGKQLWWNWVLDRERYPEWEALLADLAARDIRVMLYVNPFLVEREDAAPGTRNLRREAEARDLLVRTPAGGIHETRITSFSAALVDLSKEEARDWMVDVIQQQLLGVGASGWMADFGEALPWNGVLAGDVAAPAYHNRYPEVWAEVNRRAIDEAGRGDDVVFFTRSGFTRSPRHSTLFWLGDQLVSWDAHDGIKSAVTGILSGGISGFAFNHSDIGGYTTLDRPLVGFTRSRELLQRWSELAAFGTVFRTHEGNDPDANHQIDSDPETLDHFSRMAKIHAAWSFYRDALVREAAATGAPVLRHPYLHYPDDPTVRTLRYEQFMLGRELMVAPVLDPGHREVEIYLPAGLWVNVWNGKVRGDQEHGTWRQVAAPPGRPVVFHRAEWREGERLRNALAAVR
jgi:alpha-glucosidase